MRILLVIDQFFSANNGMTISARRFAQVLAQHGHEVKVVSTGKNGDTEYLMPVLHIPFFDELITAQGMAFAKPEDALLRKAVEWADVVHILVPFMLSRHAIKLCLQTRTPFTGAFHVQPENVTSSIHMQKWNFVNTCIYRWFHFYIYRYCTHIHCPSRFIADQLIKNGYRSELHVISNGIDPDFVYRKKEKPAALADRFIILMVGRLSVEKRQDVLIRAVAMSKYADRIHLILAGKGPREKHLRLLAEKTLAGTTYEIRFFEKQELMDRMAISDLYVHSAEAEIEAMSCMEAFASGLVPVIANSKKSATPQFALNDRCLFEAGCPQDLAHKIDDWVEHPDERQALEKEYSEFAKRYQLEACVEQAEEMFETAIQEGAGVAMMVGGK